jgi:flagellar motor switch protein FliN/FliY
MTNHDQQAAAQQFVQSFAEALAAPLTGASGQPWKITVQQNSAPSSQTSSPIVFRLALDGLLRGEFFLEFRDEHVKQLAAAIRSHAAQPIGNDDGQTLRAVLSSAMNSLSSSLFAEFGTVTGKVEQAMNPALKGMAAFTLTAEGRESSPIPVTCYLDGKLIALAPSMGTKGTAQGDIAPFDPVNLNLVLDVELSMSLRFGVRQLPLRDVLELSSGSVVELDRQVDDPVELLLDGRVIARGEAVIVDGNYGLRVTEITEPIASNFVR